MKSMKPEEMQRRCDAALAAYERYLKHLRTVHAADPIQFDHMQSMMDAKWTQLKKEYGI